MSTPAETELSTGEDGGAPRLAACLGRLDQIVRRLDAGDLELEDQMSLYVEGCQNVVSARRIIRESILRIDQLVESVQGEVSLEPRPAPVAR